MQPSDLGSYRSVSAVAVSPDGATAALVVTAIDLPGNRYRSRIWLAPTDGSTPPQQLTAGDADGAPTWSPDGRTLAFTSDRGSDDAKQSLHLVPLGRPGETVTLATGAEGFTALRWSPDGRWLAYVQRARTADAEITDPKARPPRHITRFFTRLDDVGWTVDRPRHLFVIPVDGSLATRDLTPGEHEFDEPGWLADSSGLVCSGADHADWDIDLQQHLHLVPLDGERRRLTDGSITASAPSVSPDGRRVAFVGRDDPLTDPMNATIGILDLGSGERRWLDTGLDRTWSPYPSPGAPRWVDDATVLAPVEDRGNVHLYRVPVDGGPIALAAGGDRVVTAFDHAGGVTVLAESLVDRPSEAVVLDAPGAERRLTRVTDAFCAAARPITPERFTAGDHEIDVWVFLPPGFDPVRTASYPLLIDIHGGPFTQYGNRFFDEAQIQASAGYVTVLSNPRGGSGRDTAWGRAITGPKSRHLPGAGWGSVDADDIHTVVDTVLARYPAVDAGRLGVLGGSYGGYLTTWLVGHGDRFAAALSERAVNNLLTEEWTSDIASVFHTEIGVNHLEDPDEYVRMSPMTYVRNIRTPLMIMHAEDDLRCPINQAEELFVALRLLRRDVEFVRFPGEGHELSRSGSPIHRRQRFEIQLDFFARHLGAAG